MSQTKDEIIACKIDVSLTAKTIEFINSNIETLTIKRLTGTINIYGHEDSTITCKINNKTSYLTNDNDGGLGYDTIDATNNIFRYIRKKPELQYLKIVIPAGASCEFFITY